MVAASVEQIGLALVETIDCLPEVQKMELRKEWLADAEAYLRNRWYSLHEIKASEVQPWLAQFTIFVAFRPRGVLN